MSGSPRIRWLAGYMSDALAGTIRMYRDRCLPARWSAVCRKFSLEEPRRRQTRLRPAFSVWRRAVAEPPPQREALDRLIVPGNCRTGARS